jgi:hypothetical protein
VSNSISDASDSFSVAAKLLTPAAPTVVAVTQPSCAVATGTFQISSYDNARTYTFTPAVVGISGTGLVTANAGTYTFTVDNADGCTSVASSNIVVNAQPATPTAPTAVAVTQPTCAVATGTFQISSYDNARTYTFSPAVVSISVTGLVTANAGTYTFTVDNAAGCTSSASANIVVNAQPATPEGPQGPSAQSFCSLTSPKVSNLSATGSAIKWYNVTLGGTSLDGNLTLNSGTYYASQTSEEGCESTVRLEVVVDVLVAQTFTETACNSYVWSATGATYTQSGIYTSAVDCSILDLTIENCPPPCQFQTYSQGGWSNANSPLNATFFSANFPYGLTIGQAGRSIRLTSITAVRKFLPNSGTPARLAVGNAEDPNNKKVKNTFAGQLVALILNVKSNPGLENAVINSNNSFNGKTVAMLIQESQNAIGSFTNLTSTILSGLANACEAVNLSFVNNATGYISCPSNEARMATEELATISSGIEFTSYPNPSNTSFTITNPSNFDVTVTVYSIVGKVVTKQHILPSKSNYSFGLEYEAGMYLVEIQGNNFKDQLKVIKK